ncbi:MAG: hypothetical protein JW820_08625 [Spirochaetales bacterium]|nr:hypothetical protein [Spirochaetales bacterium]
MPASREPASARVRGFVLENVGDFPPARSFAFPSFLNVFLGRLNAYAADNGLGGGLMVGEKATLASQRAVRRVSESSRRRTHQIAASTRSGEQVRDLAGVDVMTMPVAGDLFPRLRSKDLDAIAAHGKIPKHSHWADQKALDDRIRRLIA